MPPTPAWNPLTTMSNINYAQILSKSDLPYTTKTSHSEFLKKKLIFK